MNYKSSFKITKILAMAVSLGLEKEEINTCFLFWEVLKMKFN